MSTATLANNAKNVPLLTSLYNIQYPNCRIGMFSLREPFKNMNIESLPINNTPITNGNLNAMDPQPSNLNINKSIIIIASLIGTIYFNFSTQSR